MPIVDVRAFPTRAKGDGIQTIANGAKVDFSGTDNKTKRRTIIVSNLDAANLVYICKFDTLGTELIPVQPGTSIGIDTSADLSIKNSSGGDVDVVVCELFYDVGLPSSFFQLPGGGGSAPAGGGGSYDSVSGGIGGQGVSTGGGTGPGSTQER